jgi:branched-chain amino acid transport system substrate-binding protein
MPSASAAPCAFLRERPRASRGRAQRAGRVAVRRVEQVVVDAGIFTPGGVRDGLTRLFDAGVDAITTGFRLRREHGHRTGCRVRRPYLHAMASQAQAEVVADNRSRYRNIFQVCPTEAHYGIGFLRFLDRLTAQRRWRPPNLRLAFIETALPSGQTLWWTAVGPAASSAADGGRG